MEVEWGGGHGLDRLTEEWSRARARWSLALRREIAVRWEIVPLGPKLRYATRTRTSPARGAARHTEGDAEGGGIV
eukprot:COSAG06_NODE_45880_length_351_cov_0.821429_1_plen_74_part_10